MPFQIVRNDITQVKADAIVNTANPMPVIGNGTDSAIYEAAGKDRLLAERKKIGNIGRGEAVATPAFDLDAKYIIHTVGPVWRGGNNGEYEILKMCYKNSMELALEKGCESIAFPLMATGIYGFPKDKALKIATSTIQDFLFEHDMIIFLVVFDRMAFELSGKLFLDVKSFVDENYVVSSYDKEYCCGEFRVALSVQNPKDKCVRKIRNSEIDKVVSIHEDSFQERLFKLIDKSGQDDVNIYKRANVTKKVFSDIRTKKNYNPSKKTAIAFAIALELPIDEAVDLLARAGYAFSPSIKFDAIVRYLIENGVYDMVEINNLLFAFANDCIGVIA